VVVRREGFVMAYPDFFFVMGIALALCIFAPTMAH
jgi:hypothetical protein